METKRAHVLISGRVQGVFFRAWVKQRAEGLGLVGWVRNTPEGKVEAVFDGNKEKIEEMIKLCHQGPLLAKVEKVEVRWDQATGEFEEFSMIYQ